MRVILLTQRENLYLPAAIDRVCAAIGDEIVAVVTAPAMSTHGGALRGFWKHVRLFGPADTLRILARMAAARARALVGRTDPEGRPSSIRAAADRYDLRYEHVRNVNGPEFGAICDQTRPELLISMSCPQIIRRATRDRFSRGCINVHGSPLPRYRGLMPAFWVLRNGESATAATVHDLVDRLDDGAILAQKPVAVAPDETWDSLVRKTKAVGADALVGVIDRIRQGRETRRPNRDEQASYFSFPSGADRKVFLQQGRRFFAPASGTVHRIRVHDAPAPGQPVRVQQAQARPVTCLSFDVEDWYHVLDTQAAPPSRKWMSLPDRLERNVNRILDTLAGWGVPATFFWLGWSARRHPELVRRCLAEGHEVASHGWEHLLAYQVGPRRFQADIVRAKDQLEDLTGKKILGFRAPGFGIRGDTGWALELIRQTGYAYDASLFPAPRSHGGDPDAPVRPSSLATPAGPLVEIPMSVTRILGRRYCLFSGGYLRLAPQWLIRRAADRIRRQGRPLVSLIHPRELDPSGPRLDLPALRRFKCYVNLRTTAAKLDWLCGQPGLTKMADLARQVAAEQTTPTVRKAG